MFGGKLALILSEASMGQLFLTPTRREKRAENCLRKLVFPPSSRQSNMLKKGRGLLTCVHCEIEEDGVTKLGMNKNSLLQPPPVLNNKYEIYKHFTKKCSHSSAAVYPCKGVTHQRRGSITGSVYCQLALCLER